MKMTRLQKVLSVIVCIVLIAAMAWFTIERNDDKASSAALSKAFTDGSVLGQGEKAFAFAVTDGEGRETVCEIRSDAKTVGEALLALGIISGEDGAYGLYVKNVNGITADYDRDGTYWAFYADGQYALTGVDATDIVSGAVYAFKVEK